MNNRIMVLVCISLAVLLLTAVAATSAFAEGHAPYWQQGTPGGWGGMMGGWRYSNPSTTITNTQPYGRYGSGMMGGCGMMGGWGVPANANPISMDQAVAAAQLYVAAYHNSDLGLAEIMEFTNNFYVHVTEKSTGTGAFEVLVNRYTGAVSPEPGPNMMWNTRYGMMSGNGGGMMGHMMGGYPYQPAGPMSVSVAQAQTNAQQFLDANFPGAKLADDQDTFYGYYTMDFLQNGKIVGMLSVNGYTGQVWYHTWHGAFVAEREL